MFKKSINKSRNKLIKPNNKSVNVNNK